ncbi:Hypothetical_protein [Hexamita inflata]|uniref:Hypothetical_protein n=1 Tax=Hexamita inflata TaxID=28002 RepID=A0AA86PH40_9EUKA|nr:Hypothetical protein HINF_LOCUS25841 [Hexamita inflata]
MCLFKNNYFLNKVLNCQLNIKNTFELTQKRYWSGDEGARFHTNFLMNYVSSKLDIVGQLEYVWSGIQIDVLQQITFYCEKGELGDEYQIRTKFVLVVEKHVNRRI